MTASGNPDKGVQPVYQIKVNGVDVTDTMGDRLLSLQTTDFAGQQTDTVEITLDDRDKRIELPPEGATLSIAIGYEGKQLQPVGEFLVDEVQMSNGPRSVVVKGLGAAQGGGGAGGGPAGAAGTAGPARTVSASWYSPASSSNRTANGETFTGNDQTAAHKTLPFGTLLKVTNSATGQSTVVRINDRGPFVDGREIDLSRAAAEKIGLLGAGVGNVEIAEVSKVPPAPVLPPPNSGKPNTGGGGASTGVRDYIKLRRTQDWHNPPYKTLLSIIRAIAARNSLGLEVLGGVPEIPIRHEDQTNESDANFLTRMADRYGLVIKPSGGLLLVAVRASGEIGPNLDIKQTDVESWRARIKERARYKKVRARYIDRASRKEKLVTATAKEAATGSTFELPTLHRSKDEAERAAKAKVRGLTSGVVGVDLVLRGAPSLTAEGTVTLEGFRDEIDGQPWVIRSVSHQITGRSVFTTSVQCGTEGDDSDVGGGGAEGGGIAPGAGGPKSQRIADAAAASAGMNTTGSGLGSNACVWSVNRVLERAGVTPPWGNSNYVPTARAALANGAGVKLSGPEPGAIAIMRDSGNPPYPHIGIVQGNGQIISNSSTRGSFSWSASPSSYDSYYGGKTEFWRIK